MPSVTSAKRKSTYGAISDVIECYSAPKISQIFNFGRNCFGNTYFRLIESFGCEEAVFI